MATSNLTALDELAPAFRVAPSPHLANTRFTTQWMMLDVLIGLSPVLAVSLLVFGWLVVVQVGLCVLSCLGAEAIFSKMRGRPFPWYDGSAVVTGVLLALSLPAIAPPYVGVIGSIIAIGLGKAVFGGLGYNLFNPAMVGRAFVMLSFAAQMGAPAYVVSPDSMYAEYTPAILTQATPLNVAKEYASNLAKGKADSQSVPEAVKDAAAIEPLFLGTINGSLGETSAVALLIGGLYLCLRRTASWQIPMSILATTFLLAQACHWAGLTPFDGIRHLLGGSLMLGAFFIATDPVSSPLAAKGKTIFGIGIGVLVVLIRVFSGYSEGLMFAVLLMNATVPLINRWTIPTPRGGPVPSSKP
ncbi:MAG: RnfABCDGE type electron transport complex subunit D [Pirellulales bacterium]|nr:RnfABCDGE type electron transport complex subunit D [Pirellulales bacterium]